MTLVEMIHTIEEVPALQVARARRTDIGYDITVRNNDTGLEKKLHLSDCTTRDRLTWIACRLGGRKT